MSSLHLRQPSTSHLISHEGISYLPLTRLTSPCGRLTLDPLVLNDVQTLYNLSHVPFDGHPNTHPYYGRLPRGPFASLAEYTAFLQSAFWASPEHCMFVIRTSKHPDGVTDVVDGPIVIGVLGFIETVPAHSRTEIGHVWYDTRYRGTFAGKAAPATLLTWAFEELGLHRVQWKCDDRNKASKGAAQSLGFKYEGAFRKHLIVRDGFARTTVYFAMTDDDWRDSVKEKLWKRLGVASAVE